MCVCTISHLFVYVYLHRCIFVYTYLILYIYSLYLYIYTHKHVLCNTWGLPRTASPSKANSSPMCQVEWGPGGNPCHVVFAEEQILMQRESYGVLSFQLCFALLVSLQKIKGESSVADTKGTWHEQHEGSRKMCPAFHLALHCCRRFRFCIGGPGALCHHAMNEKNADWWGLSKGCPKIVKCLYSWRCSPCQHCELELRSPWGRTRNAKPSTPERAPASRWCEVLAASCCPPLSVGFPWVCPWTTTK